MAYLRKSQVTGLSPRGIDLNTITTPAGARINGDITSHTLKMADTFTVVDDITISDNLILAKVSDDGDDLILTSDNVSDRTIEGSGSIEGSTIAQTPNASLTGMTGVVGSAVTGGAGLLPTGVTSLGTVTTGTLGSGVVFPAGHVVQTLQYTAAEQTCTSTHTLINEAFTPKFANSKYFIQFVIPNFTGSADNYVQGKVWIGTSSSYASNTNVIYTRGTTKGTGATQVLTLNGIDYGSFTSSSTATHYVALVCTVGTTTTIGRHSAVIKMVLQEIAG